MRLKTLEESLKHFSSCPTTPNVFLGSPKAEKSNILGFLTTSDGLKKRSTSQPRASSLGSPLFQQTSIKNKTNCVGGNLKQESSTKKKNIYAENMLKKGIWASRSKIADNGEKENEMEVNTVIDLNQFNDEREAAEMKTTVDVDEDSESKKSNNSSSDDVVSGFLYDRLQKDVINLRKCCETKDISLQAKDGEIKVIVTVVSYSHLIPSHIELST